ncbi:unnamed protein product, partial [Staurois parvus]
MSCQSAPDPNPTSSASNCSVCWIVCTVSLELIRRLR